MEETESKQTHKYVITNQNEFRQTKMNRIQIRQKQENLEPGMFFKIS